MINIFETGTSTGKDIDEMSEKDNAAPITAQDIRNLPVMSAGEYKRRGAMAGSYVLRLTCACGRWVESVGENRREARKEVKDLGWKVPKDWDDEPVCKKCREVAS